MHSPLTEPLHQLARGWRRATAASHFRLAAALVALVWVLALLLARHGTAGARAGAAAAMAASLACAAGWSALQRRWLARPERIVRRLAAAVDRERAERALRALSLLGPDGDVRDQAPAYRGVSADLARLHIERALAALPSERIVERAARLARVAGVAALVVGAGVLGLAIAHAWSVLEGGDVLLARHGVAPATMRWLDDIDLVARPPDYLHEPARHEAASLPLLLPYGTVVTVRGAPVHPERRLLLSDGTAEVPFVDDGAGAVVARWTLTAPAVLRVVARFGDVVVPGPDPLSIESIPDEAPLVRLEGAPRQVRLVDQHDDIDVRYEATDDHGLREVHLVLRSGVREERRVLSRLDGETRSDKGGVMLALRDPFVHRSHAPIEVTVEAEDNDPLTGPKWGKSPAITLIPADVGEPEARRLDGLRELRDALVDTLAWRLSSDPPADAAARAALIAGEKKHLYDDEALLRRTLAEAYAGVRVPARLRGLLLAQQQKTRAAVDAETRALSASTHAAAVRATERYVLVVDAVIRGLGHSDSRAAARQLADVADDLALGASQQQDEAADARSRGAARMDAATLVLGGGSRAMKRLGALGLDLGEIIEADLLRVKRARGGGDFVHAELAARDLAARLREPDPSFGARGGVQRGGGESGGGRGTPGEQGEDSGDEVDQAQQQAEQDLEQLAQDHAGQIGKTEQALAEATSDEEMKRLREEARRHADAVREAARRLPAVGMGSDSWTSKGAAARELAEQMARSLEQGQVDDAVQSGRSSLGSLDEAKKMLQKGSWIEDPTGDEQRLVDDVRRKLDAEETWAEQQRDLMRKRAAERARHQLEQGGEQEGKLADRARELGDHARDRGSLPQQAIESIERAERAARQAAQALRQGDALQGLEQQREAQRDLEAAREQLRGDDDDDGEASSRRRDDGDGKRPGTNDDVKIPGAHKGPEDFRRRVVRGLGEPASGALQDAVHRYAEGLLR